MKKNINYTIYPIYFPEYSLSGNLEKDITAVCQAGISILQFRYKGNVQTYQELAEKVKQITDKYNISLIINDNIQITQEINAAGVHLGQSDESIIKARDLLGPEKIIGLSVTSFEQAQVAEQLPVDYLGVGAIYPTDTKKNAVIVGEENLKKIIKHSSKKIIAIGGINENNIKKVFSILKGGARPDRSVGVSIISNIFMAENVEKQTKELIKLGERV